MACLYYQGFIQKELFGIWGAPRTASPQPALITVTVDMYMPIYPKL